MNRDLEALNKRADVVLERMDRCDPLSGYYARQVALEGVEGGWTVSEITSMLCKFYPVSVEEAEAIVDQLQFCILRRV